MAEEAKNKKYLTLESVRVSYRAKDDSIHLTSTDEDFPHGFHMPIQKGTFVEEQLRTLLIERGHISKNTAAAETGLPKYVMWHESYATNQAVAETFFPIGVCADGGVEMVDQYTQEKINVYGFDLTGHQAELDQVRAVRHDRSLTASPHVLIAGATGGGKTVLLRTLIQTALLRSTVWDAMGIDLKQVEFKPYKDRMRVSETLEQAAAMMEQAHDAMLERYDIMMKEGVNNYFDLYVRSKGLLIFIDELGMLVPSGLKDEQSKREDELKASILHCIDEIAKLGRGAGIHLIVSCQRPDVSLLRAETKACFSTRIQCGKMDSTPQSLILGESGPQYNIGTNRGRAYVKNYGEGRAVQVFFRDPS